MLTIALKLQRNRLKGNIKLSFKSWNNVTRVKLYHLFIWYLVILLLRAEIVLLLSTFYIYINIIIHYISRIHRVNTIYTEVIPISEEKKKDLIDMCDYLPQGKKQFYQDLLNF